MGYYNLCKAMAGKKVFDRTVDTGIEHGTVTVMLDKEGFEVTTYRIDGEYEDSRHPKSVEFTGSLREDLARRILQSTPWPIIPRQVLSIYMKGWRI